MKERVQYLDIAKGIGIICVVIGHTIEQWSLPYNIIFSFHMPLFFVASGILFKHQDTIGLIKKRYDSLIMPYIATLVILLPIVCSKNYIKYGDAGIIDFLISGFWGAGFPVKTPDGIKSIGAIWFLLAMYWSQVLYHSVSRSGKFIKLLLCIVLASIGWLIGQSYWLPFNICAAMVALVYLWLGEYAVRPAISYCFEGKWKVSFLLALSAIWFSGWFKTLAMVCNLYPYYFYSFLTSFAGCILILYVSMFIDKSSKLNIRRYLSYMGRYSLVILCFHLVELRLPWHFLTENTSFLLLMKLFLVSLIPYCIGRVPILSKVYKLEKVYF